MIPDTVGAVFAFFLFVVPGLACELLRERRRPGAGGSAFREASRVALASTVFTGAAVLLLLATADRLPAVLADPDAWLADPAEYAADNLALVVQTVIVAVLLAVGLAVVASWALGARGTSGRLVTGSIWFAAFRDHKPDDAKVWVHLRLTDKTEIWGYAGDYTPEQELDNRELLVEGPSLQYRRENATENTALEKWAFISVRGDAISWMKVQYLAPGDGETPQPVPARYRSPGRRRAASS